MADINVFEESTSDFSSDDYIVDATYAPPQKQRKRSLSGSLPPAKKVSVDGVNLKSNIFHPKFYTDIEKVCI